MKGREGKQVELSFLKSQGRKLIDHALSPILRQVKKAGVTQPVDLGMSNRGKQSNFPDYLR